MPHLILVFFILILMPYQALGAGKIAWLLETPDGKILSATNPGKKMTPASTLKILTALYALENLGPEYRIVTPWHRDSEGNLVFTSQSHPFLTSIPLNAMVSKLAKEVEPRHFKGVLVDISRFGKTIPIDGRSSHSLRTYDAPMTPFSVNFNSVSFKTEKGKLVSGEEETPLLPMVLDPIQATRMTSGRIALPEENDFPIRYAAALTRHFLEEAGFSFENETHFRETPPEKPDILLFEAPSDATISDIVQQLMAHSNNLLANQLLLFTASRNLETGGSLTLEEAQKDLGKFMEKYLKMQNFSIVEGSGLSRKNQISCAEMIKALHAFIPYMDLMQKEPRGRYKTGTLSDVRTRAGYLQGPGGWYPYVLMTQSENEAYLRHLETLKKKIHSKKNLP